MASTLIVPVHVAALAVGRPDAQGDALHPPAGALAPMADFSRLPWTGGATQHNVGPYLSTVALENAQPFQGQLPLAPGIHVHWALPDGLTAGRDTGDGLAFPCAPNRWLVTRIVVSTAPGVPATTKLRAWVVESDRLGDTPTAPAGLPHPTVPAVPGAAGPSYAYLGQAFDADGWAEQPGAPRLEPLTALGYGEPAFAAFYPNCSTVFGYYDSLADLDEADPSTRTVSYHVAGWYAGPATDPLAVPGATPAGYGWSGPEGDAPTSTVCAGVADAVPWDPGAAYLRQAPGALAVTVAGSAREALSALMAGVLQGGDPAAYANAEQALNALQFGLLAGEGEAGSLARFEEEVHAAGFATLPAGAMWAVARAGAGGAPGEGGEVALPDAQAEALAALNALQAELNDARLALDARRFQLFVDWHKYQVVEHAPPVPVPDGRERVAPAAVWQYLQRETEALRAARSGADALQARVREAADALRASLLPPLELTDTLQAPRYYQPADPVLVLSGPGVAPSERYGGDGARSPGGLLPCRLGTQVLTAATLHAGVVEGSAETEVPASALPAPPVPDAGAPAALLRALVREAFFVAGALQPALAAAVAARGGTANPAVLDPAKTVEALRTAARSLVSATVPAGVAYDGAAPDAPYLQAWGGTPWLPLLLQYEVELKPVRELRPSGAAAGYPPGFIQDHFAFDPRTLDLQYTGAAPANVQVYTGTAVLTPSATVDLAEQVSAFLRHTEDGDPGLAAVLESLAGLPVLSQGLTGMTQALLMRAATLQMPVADPLLPPPMRLSVAALAAEVRGQDVAAPLPENSFNPIRAGTLAVRTLRLVDVFGRFRDYPSPPVRVAKGLAPPPGAAMHAGEAFLPPRITQPARLLFRWRAAADRSVESGASPATTPVLGWVVPGYLDASLQLYAAAGTPLGSLALSAGGARVLWSPAPGGDFAPGTPLPVVLQGQNPDLTAFAEGIHNGGDASFFAPFFEAVRAALTVSVPARFGESAARGVLLGQPLALARASLALDLAGPPVTDASWRSFARRVGPGAQPTSPGDDAGLGEVRFPVALGAPDHLDDTLVGYWVSPSGPAGYRTFFAPYATVAAGGVAPPAQDTLTIAPRAGGAGAVDVVMLLDPRGSVHATTGILPVKQIGIPPAQYAAALASLAVTFEIAPVLSGAVPAPTEGGAPPVAVVQPRVQGAGWTWVSAGRGAWSTAPLAGEPARQATPDDTPPRIREGWLRLEPSPPS